MSGGSMDVAGSAAKLSVALHSAGPIPLHAEFDCAAGELVALVGPSGSGKTSILRGIAGLLSPRSAMGGVTGSVALGDQLWAWLNNQSDLQHPIPAYYGRAI